MSLKSSNLCDATDYNGLLLLNKPANLTSHDCIRRIKRSLPKKHKIGHTGTLDPFATGLLPICLGQATKLAQYFLHLPKSYRAYLRLGYQTDTGDATGAIIKQADVPHLTQTGIESIFANMLGQQLQTPPMFSAKKQAGIALYKLARKGIDVERIPQSISVHALILHSFDDQHIDFSVTCSKGTYVRTLGESIAEALNSVGHLQKLQRVGIGKITLAYASDLPISTGATALPPVYDLLHMFSQWLPNWQPLRLTAEQLTQFHHGMTIAIDADGLLQGDNIYVVDVANKVHGLATYYAKILQPTRVFACG